MPSDAAWVRVSTVLAPVLLVGGWTVAAAVQRTGFDQVSGTISALAARDADHRWIMTTALAGTGLCHLATAAGLRSAARAGRWVLALGGLATVGVAAFPLPGGDGGSVPHTVAASLAFGALALWPALAARRGGHARVGRLATVVLLGLVGWFAVELGGPRSGLAERVAAAAQALYPAAAARLPAVRRP